MDSKQSPQSTGEVPDWLLEQLFPEDNPLGEEPMFQSKCKEISRWDIRKDRFIIQSTHNIYILSSKEVSKKFPISELKYYIKSTVTNELLLYFDSGYDLRVIFEGREEMLSYVQMRFANLSPNKSLKVFGVPEQTLKKYKTSNTKGEGGFAYDVQPAGKFRLRDEEILTQDEVDAQSTVPTMEFSEQNPDDFAFENRNSIVVMGANKIQGGNQISQVGGDRASDTNLLDESLIDLDNLVDNIAEMESGKTDKKRRPTLEEVNDLRSTQLVRQKTTEKPVTFEDFNFLMVIGRGSFGKVFLAELKSTKKLYAVKSIRKDILIQQDQVENTILEKDIMFECDHPFLVGMEYLFQNDLRLYFVMPFVRGGELYKVFSAQRRFSEEQVVFYAAQLTIAIGHLHMKGIAHRDLKLENILLDQDGYLKIIDFGLAKMLQDGEQAASFCGTPEYLAPEMIQQKGHDKSVDWWALGVLIYEMLIGVTPFFNKNRELLLTKIQKSKVVFPDRNKYKIKYSDEIMDLIQKLLERDTTKRLGSKDDFTEILSHPIFKNVNIEELENKKVTPPYKPNISKKDMSKYFNVSEDAAVMQDTYIPVKDKRVIDSNKDAFANFDKKVQK